MKYKIFILFVLNCLYSMQPENLAAQKKVNECGFILPDSIPYQHKFASVYEAANYINKITQATSWKENFMIERIYNANNAYATIKNGQRYIIYDNEFCERIDYTAGTKWASISILAHEVGHHYYGHVFTGTGSRPPTELEADFFSGYALAKMGASLTQAKAAMNVFGDPSESTTHPAKHRRLAAIEQGWKKANQGNEEQQNAEEWIHLSNSADRDLYVQLSDDGKNYQYTKIKKGETFKFKYDIYNYGWINIKTDNILKHYKLEHRKKYKIRWDAKCACFNVFSAK